MKSFRLIPIVLLAIASTANAAPSHRSAERGPNAGVNIGTVVAGVAVGAAVAELTSPRYAPGHKVKVVPKGAVVVKHRGVNYRYHNGVYYRNTDRGFSVVLPPVGIVINALPKHAHKVFSHGEPYYVLEGVYYKRINNGYVVVKAPNYEASSVSSTYQLGMHYDELPDGAQPVKVDGVQYFTYAGLYFLPQSIKGNVTYLALKLNE